MAISRRNRVFMPQTMALYYKSTLTIDSILHEISPAYDALSDLHNFFCAGCDAGPQGASAKIP